MLENERIIVDRGGIDPGIAALMQNANKGFDPAALMAMMNNGNGMFGGNGGWWWIFIIVLFWMWGGWGGNGFGRGNQAETNSDFARLAAMGNQNNNTDLLMQAINGNKDAINTFCQQTNTLQNAITSGFNNLSSENATRFNILGSKIDAQTQIINDKFCQLEMREMQNKIDALRDEKNALQTSAITQQQTQNIVNQIKPCPVPAYLTCNPYGCNGGFTGYGYGYGYGDSCCA